jgi:hypothetical protein
VLGCACVKPLLVPPSFVTDAEVEQAAIVREKLMQSGIVPGGTMPAQVVERFKADKKAFAEAVAVMGLRPE